MRSCSWLMGAGVRWLAGAATRPAGQGEGQSPRTGPEGASWLRVRDTGGPSLRRSARRTLAASGLACDGILRLLVRSVGAVPGGEPAGAILRDLRRPTRPTPKGRRFGYMKWSRPRPPCGVPPLVRTLIGGYHSRPLWDGSREAGKGGVQRRETEGGSGSEGRRRRESRRLFIRPHGECGGCARRGGEARDGGEPSSALDGWRGAARTAARSAGSATAGLGGRVRGSPPAPRLPGGRAALGGEWGGGAGLSPGASARGARPAIWGALADSGGPYIAGAVTGGGSRIALGASGRGAGRGRGGWRNAREAASWGAKNVFQTPEDRKRPGKDRFPWIDKAGRG
jgi:hypothetical protein